MKNWKNWKMEIEPMKKWKNKASETWKIGNIGNLTNREIEKNENEFAHSCPFFDIFWYFSPFKVNLQIGGSPLTQQEIQEAYVWIRNYYSFLCPKILIFQKFQEGHKCGRGWAKSSFCKLHFREKGPKVREACSKSSSPKSS